MFGEGVRPSPLKREIREMRYIETTQLYKMNYEELQEAGFLDYTRVRNNSIRERHAENLTKGMSAKKSIEQLSEEFFISESSIVSVIYAKRNK